MRSITTSKDRQEVEDQESTVTESSTIEQNALELRAKQSSGWVSGEVCDAKITQTKQGKWKKIAIKVQPSDGIKDSFWVEFDISPNKSSYGIGPCLLFAYQEENGTFPRSVDELCGLPVEFDVRYENGVEEYYLRPKNYQTTVLSKYQ